MIKYWDKKMSTPAGSKLSEFNSLALHYQDEAYTLAYYLLGSNRQAEEVVQGAFLQVYQHAGVRLDHFRLEVLQRILIACQQRQSLRYSDGAASDDLCRQLLDLGAEERSALLLVDLLGLNYTEAARVMGCSKKQTGKWLAQARLNLGQSSHSLRATL